MKKIKVDPSDVKRTEDGFVLTIGKELSKEIESVPCGKFVLAFPPMFICSFDELSLACIKGRKQNG